MATRKAPAKRSAKPAKPAKNTTVTTSGTVLGSLISINIGGGGRSGRRGGGGLTKLLAGLLKGASGGGKREERPGRGDVDERLDVSGGLEQAGSSTDSQFLNPGRATAPRAGQRQSSTPASGPRRAR